MVCAAPTITQSAVFVVITTSTGPVEVVAVEATASTGDDCATPVYDSTATAQPSTVPVKLTTQSKVPSSGAIKYQISTVSSSLPGEVKLWSSAFVSASPLKVMPVTGRFVGVVFASQCVLTTSNLFEPEATVCETVIDEAPSFCPEETALNAIAICILYHRRILPDYGKYWFYRTNIQNWFDVNHWHDNRSCCR